MPDVFVTHTQKRDVIALDDVVTQEFQILVSSQKK